ncbi:MAG: hypothetical protein GY830_03900 [Bacteroidetes bacterium]|nr:hypothetical protein [Bacteroidota bacterium]
MIDKFSKSSLSFIKIVFLTYLLNSSISKAGAIDNVSNSNKESLIEKEIKEEPIEYAYVGLGEDNLSKPLEKNYRRDFYRYNYILNNWIKLKKFPGGRRTDSISLVVKGKAYVGCGKDDGDPSLKIPERYREDIYRYNTKNDTWSLIAPFPLCLRRNMIAFTIKSIGYVGLGRFGAKNFANIFKYNTIQNKWIKAFEYESKQNPKLVFTINDTLFLGGKTFFCLDKNDQWKQLQNIPEGNNADVVFVIKDKAYVGFGGMKEKNLKSKKRRKSKKYFKENLFYSYDPKNDKWTEIKPFPGKSIRGCVAFTLNNKGYVGLGEDNDGNLYKEFYCYDPENNSWQKITDLPSRSRKNSVAFVLKNENHKA